MKIPLISHLLALTKKRIVGRFDAAQTTSENAAHWSMATGWSADVEANSEVRRILRNRARYETANNPWVNGMIVTQAYDVIGTGPRLQMTSEFEEFNSRIEQDFGMWCREIGLAELLHTAQMTKCRDGETFMMLSFNPRLRNRVKLDVLLIEADRVTNLLDGALLDESNIDGIQFDAYGNPVWYNVLKHHPGGRFGGLPNDSRTVSAEYIIHMFRQDRPGQHRGVPEITPALPLFALLRRYTLAMVKKMETSANISGVIETDNLPEEDNELQPFKAFPLPRDSFAALPAGYKLQQHTLQNPTDSQSNFALQVKTEVARCLSLPKNVALGDSSGYNYSSGRLDYQAYDKFLWVERMRWERQALDVIFGHWLREYVLTMPMQPGRLLQIPKAADVPHAWYWDGREHVDPGKEATAQKQRLENNTTTLAEECARQGLDWEEVLKQRAKERERMKELGLLAAPAPVEQLPPPRSNKDQEDNDDEDDSDD
ncbi:phage portal protein [Victivallis vadensis]|uniref:phage portal protein n=1 Tax=Victivallis vadensis TaxID=172901 RepID=UPI0023F70D19|nr:phage portal protein [Victivallis vadensis]